MIDPPSPGISALLLAAARLLGWRPVSRDASGRELGHLFGPGDAPAFLAMSASPRPYGAPGAVSWSFCAVAPPGVAVYLLPRDAAAALSTGEACDDGSIALDGAAVRLVATWDGAAHVAALVKA